MLLKSNNNNNSNNLLHRINNTRDKGTIKDQTFKPKIEWILVRSPAHVPPEQRGERQFACIPWPPLLPSEYVSVQTVNQRLRDCTNSRKICTHPKDRRITMTSPPVNLSLLGGCRRRLTLLVRGHLPAGYSHEMAERRRGAKEREEKEAGRGKSEGGRWQRRRTVYLQAVTRKRDGEGCGGAHAAQPASPPPSPCTRALPPPPPFTIFRPARILIAVSQCTRSESAV